MNWVFPEVNQKNFCTYSFSFNSARFSTLSGLLTNCATTGNFLALEKSSGSIVEDNMITFLKSGSYASAADDAALKDKWYNFDHVNFKMGSSTELEAGSQGQLENLVAILKAYPQAKIKIGGYTDKVGNEAANVKLSGERATYIKDWLAKQGVASQVTGADGYGSEFATVDASASDAERAADRKMAVRAVEQYKCSILSSKQNINKRSIIVPQRTI